MAAATCLNSEILSESSVKVFKPHKLTESENGTKSKSGKKTESKDGLRGACTSLDKSRQTEQEGGKRENLLYSERFRHHGQPPPKRAQQRPLPICKNIFGMTCTCVILGTTKALCSQESGDITNLPERVPPGRYREIIEYTDERMERKRKRKGNQKTKVVVFR